MTTSVTDDQVHAAAKAYYEALHINASWDTQRQSLKDASMNYMRTALEAALRSQGKVVEVSKLELLPRCDMFSEGFHNGSSCIEYDWNPDGDWIKYDDLTAIIGEGD